MNVCVVCIRIKDKKPGQTRQRSRDKVYEENKKARICGQSLTGVAGSNPDGGMDVCVMLCRGRSEMSTKGTKVHNG
jgi:hypothetical protein